MTIADEALAAALDPAACAAARLQTGSSAPGGGGGDDRRVPRGDRRRRGAFSAEARARADRAAAALLARARELAGG